MRYEFLGAYPLSITTGGGLRFGEEEATSTQMGAYQTSA
jgi:hypothetical protein